MLFFLSKIWVWLLVAALLGGVLAWLLLRRGVGRGIAENDPKLLQARQAATEAEEEGERLRRKIAMLTAQVEDYEAVDGELSRLRTRLADYDSGPIALGAAGLLTARDLKSDPADDVDVPDVTTDAGTGPDADAPPLAVPLDTREIDLDPAPESAVDEIEQDIEHVTGPEHGTGAEHGGDPEQDTDPDMIDLGSRGPDPDARVDEIERQVAEDEDVVQLRAGAQYAQDLDAELDQVTGNAAHDTHR